MERGATQGKKLLVRGSRRQARMTRRGAASMGGRKELVDNWLLQMGREGCCVSSYRAGDI